jgi:hypothetical protein
MVNKRNTSVRELIDLLETRIEVLEAKAGISSSPGSSGTSGSSVRASKVPSPTPSSSGTSGGKGR